MEERVNWPEDLVIEIQLRLPIKSLLRFKCVSKPWYVRFLNSNFIRSHYLKQKDLDGDNFDNSNIFYLRENIFYESDRGPFDFFYYFIKFEETDMKIKAKENILLPYAYKDNSWKVKGHCMGVFCLDYMEKLGLWNPATREFKLFERPKHKNYIGCDGKTNEFTRVYMGVGFGCDSKTSELKIVQGVQEYRPIEGGVESNYRVEIYSLHSQKWKIFSGDAHDMVSACIHNFHYWNGSCYWKSKKSHSEPCYILSFDMTNETFKVTDTDIDEYECQLYSSLECLGAVASLKDPNLCFDIWKFKDLDDKSSWTRQRVDLESMCIKNFLSFWKNGDMFTTDDDHELVLYDPASKTFKKFDTCLKTNPANYRSKEFRAFDCIIYVESLIILGGGKHEFSEGIERMQLS